ncbi:hypothetical protein FA15DRAFT_658391 [Coprinopsis marcescibilis]|uniref:Uncharacterized protein n=1 Tax=Coprinopsis marcescibilis TaxID=230819 RepID=A0A5C3KLY1_COPMA|nr:hypothetical protein FA15DRAFT_658391 [Coprinopsis marcescibilis]
MKGRLLDPQIQKHRIPHPVLPVDTVYYIAEVRLKEEYYTPRRVSITDEPQPPEAFLYILKTDVQDRRHIGYASGPALRQKLTHADLATSPNEAPKYSSASEIPRSVAPYENVLDATAVLYLNKPYSEAKKGEIVSLPAGTPVFVQRVSSTGKDDLPGTNLRSSTPLTASRAYYNVCLAVDRWEPEIRSWRADEVAEHSDLKLHNP